MKKILIITPVFLFFVLNCELFGVSQPLNLDNSNYVVIGAFANQSNATQFVENAKRLNFKAEFAINPSRKLFYVYVLHTEDKSLAIVEAMKIRTETPFNDTWVFKGLLGENVGRHFGTDVNPANEQNISQVVVSDQSQTETIPENNQIIANTEKAIERVNATENKFDNNNNTVASSQNVPQDFSRNTNENNSTSVNETAAGAKAFIFKIASLSGNELTGDIDIIDSDRLTKAASYDGNKRVFIKPVNKTGKLKLICQVFGYRKVQKDLNYNLPDSTSGIKIENGDVVVSFDLTRLKKGDFAIMYNVYFYKDAAIMRPESRYEVTSLLEMMKENPKYKIRLHGHTNGNSAGKIIKMGDSKNFFSLSDTKDGFGSAKELSESRAEQIRDFLISEGIQTDRLLIKAWGGKKSIQEKNSAKANENVRVEVEILED